MLKKWRIQNNLFYHDRMIKLLRYTLYRIIRKYTVILYSLFVLILLRSFSIKIKCSEVVNDMDLIARISELLDERGWSKYQLAKEADLSQSTISSMVKRGNNPNSFYD